MASAPLSIVMVERRVKVGAWQSCSSGRPSRSDQVRGEGCCLLLYPALYFAKRSFCEQKRSGGSYHWIGKGEQQDEHSVY